MGPILVETLHKIDHYTPAQLQRAVRIAHQIGRGKLVLAEWPERKR